MMHHLTEQSVRLKHAEGTTIMVVVTLFFLLITLPVRSQQVTISNNLLYDATLTPNLRVGVRLAPHWSMGVTAGYRPWPTDDNVSTKWRHLLVSPDLRYWTDSVDVHHFFGVNLIYSHYNLANLKFPFGLYKGFRHERREGDLGALGAFYGYSWPLGRHWNIEALIGAFVGYAKYDRYACGKCGTKIGDNSRWFVLPQAALNIVFNIPGRPRKTIPQVMPPIDTLRAIEIPVVETAHFDTVPVAPKERNIDVLLRTEPILAHISDYKPYDRSKVLRRDKNALFVYFPQSEVKIRTDWRDNQKTLDRILDITQKLYADEDAMICKIQIVGLASFDGPQKMNESIAKQRAFALKRYLQEHMPLADDQFEVVFGGEGWADFRDHLEESIANGSDRAAELQQVLDIVDNESDPTRREQKIKSLNRGRTYQYIKEHHLADQRNSGYLRVYFDYVENSSK